MEQTASHSTSPVFSKEDEQRYQQLAARYIDGKTDAAQETEFQQLRQKKMAARAEREQCIAQLINVITEQEISFAELTQAGFRVPAITDLYSDNEILKAAKALGFTPLVKALEASQPKMSGKKRETNGYIKSIRNPDKTVDWRAGAPKFLKEEGCLDAYSQGKPIDQWLVDPKNEQSKIKFLHKLATKQKHKQEPNKEQLGDITAEAYMTALPR
ncbi:hypothetical protein [Comamonas thiooxydans]|uniref:Uncharacterized protein n=1 Tax=Comamonas thiooxydans TaxID=363952 RepID=A0A0E3CGX6_9BURK|nr:hypothetical protein [Comamonas thiooxydans]KGH12937.1 hypothetical protein P608_09865 [Comamonas thiooxydans]KGH24038.1 hypothetical protein P606_10080 [Comamonas thiooxydans]KGH25666.1 hypothetical protein P607_05455 [Comamonas thiooxydans]